MRPDFFNRLLRHQPFQPFRVFVSDGATYDVAHPEAALVEGATLAVQVQPAGFAEPPGTRYAQISLIHVSRVEIYRRGAAVG
jgi:hypothetical protein